MACITFSGFPCSGKTTRANELKAYLEQRLSSPEYTGEKFKVVIVSDDSLSLSRSAYDDSRSEKPARSALFTSLTRELSAHTILIVDAMNYIKGFRYQIYCAAREASVNTCTVFVAATPTQCRDRNAARSPSTSSPSPDSSSEPQSSSRTEGAYKSETFENLLTRYEEPSSMVRWDAPLFTIPWDEALPGDAIFQVVVEGRSRKPNQGVVQVAKPPTDALQVLESTTSSIISQLLSAQSTSGGIPSSSIRISLPSSPPSSSSTSKASSTLEIHLPQRTLTLSELQRLKRQFIAVHKKAVTQGAAGRADLDWSEGTVGGKFGRFLEDNLT